MASRGRCLAGHHGLNPDIRCFAAGSLCACLLLYYSAQLPPGWLAWSGLILGGLGLYGARRHWLVAVVTGLLLTGSYAVLVAQSRLDDRLPVAEHGSERLVHGTVASIPEVQTTAAGRILRFSFEPAQGAQQRIRVGWYGTDARPGNGDCWALTLRLRSPRGSQNPGGLDYEGWLFRQGIDATASVREGQRCRDDALRPLGRLRQLLAERLQQRLEGHSMLPFVLGLTVGERSQITTEQWQVLRRSGVAHLLAISGLHIGLVAGFAFLLFNRLWGLLPSLTTRLPALHAGALAAAVFGLGYAALAGFSLPTQRALIMLLVFLLALFWRRRIQGSRLLAWALLLVLLLDPFAVASAGFWLSFAAVGWIFYVLQARLRAPAGWRLWLWLQCVLGLALLPLTLFWFGEGSWLAPLANLVMIPLFFVLVPAILLSGLLAVAGSSDWLQWPLHISADALQILWTGLTWTAQQVPTLSNPAPASVWAVVLAVLGCIWLFAPRGWPARPLGVLLLLPLLLPTQRTLPPQGALDVAVLDVGQGLSVVLRSAGHVLVYDAGPAWDGGFDAGAMVLVPYLRHAGIRRVDRLLLSHGDLDHRGGLAALRREMAVLDELGTERGLRCRRGQQWAWDGLRFEVLHPSGPATTGNNASCVLRVQAGDKALLLTGDIERAAELQLLAAQRGALDAEVMLVPHHGSNSSSTIGLLNAVDPALAIVSAGWRNQWGLPAEKVLRRYAARDVRVLNTAQAGAIRFRLDPQSGVTQLGRDRIGNRRFWHAE